MRLQNRLFVVVALLVAMLAAALPAFAQDDAIIMVGGNDELGAFFTDAEGMTLYIRTSDEPNMSLCTGGCLENWPALTVASEDELVAGEGVPGELGVITREDTGDMQVTYNHMPLYYWINDAAPGDATGQGVGEVWFVVKPEVVVVGGNDELGSFLTDAAGMTLYLFTVDEPGMSACTDSCLDNWPPLTVESEDELVGGLGLPGELSVFERADSGDLQVAYNDMALYYWVSDAEPGDATGQGVGDVWYVIAPELVNVGSNDDLGEFLTDAEGMTLYIRTSDEPGMSLCTGGCLENWPALTVTSENELVLGEGVEGDLGVITREDTGEMQVTLNDMPLYYWINDAAPGDATGQGVGEVWYVVSPSGEVMQ